MPSDPLRPLREAPEGPSECPKCHGVDVRAFTLIDRPDISECHGCRHVASTPDFYPRAADTLPHSGIDTQYVIETHPLRPLTPMQAKVAALVGRGYKAPRIARELGLDVSTVRSHIQSGARCFNNPDGLTAHMIVMRYAIEHLLKSA